MRSQVVNSFWYHAIGTLLFLVVMLVSKNVLEKGYLNSARRPQSLPTALANSSSVALKQYHFGFSNLLSALLWIELLQKASDSAVTPGSVSWEYTQLNAITDLDTNFDRAYGFGSIYLSVLRQDRDGARALMEKWTRRFPTEWRAAYLLGYHLQFEFGEHEAAGRYLTKASLLRNAPPWLASLGVRLLSHAGSLAQALKLSLELYDSLPSAGARVHLKERVRALNYALQRAAWQGAVDRFHDQEHRYPQNLNEARRYYSEDARGLASLSPESVNADLIPSLTEKFEFRLNADGEVVSVKTEDELGIKKVGIYEKRK